MLAVAGHFLRGNGSRRTQAGDLVRRQGAGTHAALVPATVHLCRQLGPRLAAHPEHPDTLGAVELVTRDREQIDRQIPQRQGQLAHRLGGVDMQQDPGLPGDLADSSDVVDGTQLIVDMHDAGQDRIRPQALRDGLGLNQPLGIGRHVGHLETAGFQPGTAVENGLVLDRRGHDVAPACLVKFRHALDGEVVGFGRTGREHDLPRVGTQQVGDLAPPLLHRLLGAPAIDVGTGGGITEHTIHPEVLRHHFGDSWVNWRRRQIVEVDR